MSRRTAFTLVELLITVTIIAILTGIAAVSYSSIQLRARDAQRKNDLAQIKLALSNYFTGQTPTVYPAAATAITLNNSNDALTSALKPNFIKDVPLDPVNSGSNVYKYISQNGPTGLANRSFTLYATLENKEDKKGWAGGSAWAADGYRVTPDF